MAMERHKRAVAITETYTSRDGTEKKKYVTIGTLFKFDDGGLMLKLDAVPVGKEWDGTVKFYDFDAEKKAPSQSYASAKGGGQSSPSFDLDDDLPF